MMDEDGNVTVPVGERWEQGSFIDSAQYTNWTVEAKQKAADDEKLRVRPFPEGNAICVCAKEEDSAWIAQRLNQADKLESLIYDFAYGKGYGYELKEIGRRLVKL